MLLKRSAVMPVPWGEMADVHLSTYRVFCVLAGVLNPFFGVVYKIAEPGAIDPLWGRFIVALLALLLLSLSYMARRVERHFIVLVRGYFYLLTVYIVGLTALNDFSHQYTLGMLFAFTAMGVAFSLGLSKRIAPLQYYLAFTVLLAAFAGAFVDDPEAHVWLVLACMGSTALVIYVVADAKIRADRATEASEHRYHALMNAASDAILIADPQTGRLLDANQKTLDFLGRTSEQVLQMRLEELFPEEERARYMALLEAHVFDDAPVAEDVFIVGQAGVNIPVDISASLVNIEGRQLIQGIFRRHRYEAQLIQAKERAEELLRLKTSLLNNMSHELRTPLTAILGFSEVLAEEVRGEPLEHARIITESAKRLYETVNSVLGLAQLESGEATLECRPLSIADHLQEAVGMLRPLAEQKGLALHLERPQEAAASYALADETYLGRVATNLIGNAIKFTDAGEVRVAIEADEAHVYIRVSDTGTGISPEFLPNLFEEFQQESSGLSRSHEGSGLGLAITKRLVELMQGRIDVESIKGRGSTFTVALQRMPSAEVDGAAASEGRPPLELGPTGRRVLVVEDNPAMRTLVAHRLAPYCFVETASDPESAFARAQHTQFDALLIDINLTATRDGIEVLRAFRRMPAYARTPSVALTAYAMPGAAARFRAYGFDHYLAKPFTTDQLLGLLLDLFPELGQKRRREAPLGATV